MIPGTPQNPCAFWVAQGMAQRAGVGLARAVIDGWLPRSELDGIVARCAQCGQDIACRPWRDEPGRALPPGFCAIRADLDAIAALG